MQSSRDTILEAQLAQLREIGSIERAAAEAISSLTAHTEHERAAAEKRILKLRDGALQHVERKAERAISTTQEKEVIKKEPEGLDQGDGQDDSLLMNTPGSSRSGQSDQSDTPTLAEDCQCKAQLQALQSNNAVLLQDIDSLRAENNELTEKLATTAASWRRRLDSLVEETKEKLREAKAEVARKEGIIQKISAENTKVAVELEEQRTVLASKTTQIGKLLKTNQELNDRLLSDEAIWKGKLDVLVGRTKERTQELRDKILERDALIEKITAELKDAKADVARIRMELLTGSKAVSLGVSGSRTPARMASSGSLRDGTTMRKAVELDDDSNEIFKARPPAPTPNRAQFKQPASNQKLPPSTPIGPRGSGLARFSPPRRPVQSPFRVPDTPKISLTPKPSSVSTESIRDCIKKLEERKAQVEEELRQTEAKESALSTGGNSLKTGLPTPATTSPTDSRVNDSRFKRKAAGLNGYDRYPNQRSRRG